MDLSKFTSNPLIKTLLSKQLKSAMIENNVQLIAITLDDNGALAFEVFDKEPVTIIAASEVEELKNTIKTLMQ